ncbi:MAG: class I SAM-dependent methyltransferase [Elusimicrobiota bacterium]|nr:class I SAM-dependent methyltransferase [Elusimicrobiota bacterium]
MDRIDNELAHGRKISQNAEFYWGWSGVAGRLRSERRAAMYKSAGDLQPGKKALEIGCGTGIFTAIIARTGADITAVDLSPELAERARAQNPSPNVKYAVMNVEKLEFPDNSFDCVYGSSVLHHLNLPKALPEMLRVLKPGGAFVFTEPNMLNPQIMLQKNIPFLKAMMGDSPDETAFFRGKIKKILLDSGFSGVNTEPFDFLHPWVPGALAPAAGGLGAVLERIPLLREIAGSLLITATK